MKLKELKRTYNGKLYIYQNGTCPIINPTDKYDDCEILELEIGKDDNSLDAYIEKTKSKGKIFIFLGDSMTGKSTVADYMLRRNENRIRVFDDYNYSRSSIKDLINEIKQDEYATYVIICNDMYQELLSNKELIKLQDSFDISVLNFERLQKIS